MLLTSLVHSFPMYLSYEKLPRTEKTSMKKFSILMAYADRAGWLLSQGVQPEIIKWAQGIDEQLNGKGKYLVWLAMNAKRDTKLLRTPLSEFTNIRDWAVGVSADLSRFTIPEAQQAAKDWHIELAERGVSVAPTTEKTVYAPREGEQVLYTFPDGWVITSLLHLKRIKEEGVTMGNCLSGSGSGYFNDCVKQGGAILSLRDPDGNSHISMELTPEGKLVQLQGKYRKDMDSWDPTEKHAKRLLEWVQNIQQGGTIPTLKNPKGIALKPSGVLLSTVLPSDQLHDLVRQYYTKKK